MGDRPDFSERAELEEQMDGPCSYEELRDCLRHLAWVNRLTRAHRPVMQWVERVAQAQSGRDRPLKIVDVGCGYGDMLRRIDRWAAQRGVAVELVGVDVNANAVRAAREATPAASRIQWLIGDVYTCEAAAGTDLVTASGMTHHLAEAEIVRLLEWMERTARVGWFIVDLHRKPVPYRVFDVMMRGPWWHRFIRPDGLRSLRRSFLAEDWQRMCSAAGLEAGAVAIREHKPARLWVQRMKEKPHSGLGGNLTEGSSWGAGE
jgi:2-polyprenyl-3-methyl-5-hydroxy-6-metoxy-1,4-benzoquinol methylase